MSVLRKPRGKKEPTLEYCNAEFSQQSDFSSDAFPIVYVIGDVHGDVEVLRACLRMTGCVSEGLWEWNGAQKVAIVVMGDVVDRWRDGSKRKLEIELDDRGREKSVGEMYGEEEIILDTLDRLALGAQACSSAVFRLVGNHEITQMYNKTSNIDQREYASPFARGETEEEFAARQLRCIARSPHVTSGDVVHITQQRMDAPHAPALV